MSSNTLYPPIIDSYMPAFNAADKECKIYFSLSKFNGSEWNSVHVSIVKQDTGMNVIALNDDNTDTYINDKGEVESYRKYAKTGIIIDQRAKIEGDNLYSITINSNQLSSSYNNYNGWIPGWIYKIQLRLSSVLYKDSAQSMGEADWLNVNAGQFSEWSTICIVKATGPIYYDIPALKAKSDDQNSGGVIFEEETIFANTLNLAGSFDNSIDPSELIYAYKFELYNEDDKLLEDSGNIYANQYQDNNSFNYIMKTELEDGKEYKVAFQFETINHYVGGFYKISDSKDNRVTFLCSNSLVGRPPCELATVENNKERILIGEEFGNTIGLQKAFVNSDHPHAVYMHTYILTKDEKVDTTKTYYKYENAEYIQIIPSGEEHPIEQHWLEYKNAYIPIIVDNYTVISSVYDEEEEGRAIIKFFSVDDNTMSGNLCIRRADSKDNFKTWTDIYIYTVKNEKINELAPFYDYTIESGVLYKYGVQLIDKDGYRSSLSTYKQSGVWNFNSVLRDFNYSFILGKNNQQLKLKLDNTMSSFKYQVTESRVDPIGAQFTNITRNATTYYRTFPITGLISFNMDDKGIFTNKKQIFKYEEVLEDYGKIKYGSEDYDKYYQKDKHFPDLYDYTYEKGFRDKVLNFLYDGEYKLFKSPTEGNIIIRLMDITCTPNQTLDRLVFNFSANAYEMDENTLENYLKYKLLEVADWETDFSVYKTKIGQIIIQGTYCTLNQENKIENTSINIMNLIKQKYDSNGRNQAGKTIKINNIHHIKISFNSEPYLIRVGNDSMKNSTIGYSLNIKGNNVNILMPNSYYELDERMNFKIGKDTLSIQIDPIIDEENGVYSLINLNMDIVVDFLYDSAEEEYTGKSISSKKIYSGIGQIFEHCSANTKLLREIEYKYGIEWLLNFRKLDRIDSIEIEAAPGSIFYIEDANEKESRGEEHIIGATGQLRLYDLGEIQNIQYIGQVGPDNNTQSISTDVILNYCFVAESGTYKGEQ